MATDFNEVAVFRDADFFFAMSFDLLLGAVAGRCRGFSMKTAALHNTNLTREMGWVKGNLVALHKPSRSKICITY
jgi:hypothetical protein